MYHINKEITGSGENIALKNTAKHYFKNFNILGNSVQEGTPSIDSEAPIESVGDNINFFKPYKEGSLSFSYDSMSLEIDKLGIVTLNGECTADTWIEIGYDLKVSTTRQTTPLISLDNTISHTFSAKKISGTNSAKVYIYVQYTEESEQAITYNTNIKSKA